MMGMDMLDLQWRQLFCQRGTHHRVAQRANSASRGSAALPQQGPQQLPEVVGIAREPAHRPNKLVVGEGLKKPRFFPESAFRQAEIIWRDAFPATADHFRPATAQFYDFVDHIRLERSEERRVGKECRSRWS